MCGISGIISSCTSDHLLLVDRAKISLSHRGPDYFGWSTFEECGLTLAHNRLSIVDNDFNSNQPFAISSCSLIFNGEIYNHISLRSQLAAKPIGFLFQTKSDTETLAAGISNLGLDFLNKLDGMFALSFYNSIDNSLTLAVDPFGVKQIYYYDAGDRFLFGSEFEFVSKTALSLGLPLTVSTFDLECTYAFLAPPVGRSLFREINRLKPGEILNVDLTSKSGHVYFIKSLPSILRHFNSNATHRDVSNIKENNEKCIESLLSLSLSSDAKPAILCSGGIDSTAIALASESLIDQHDYPLLFAEHPTSFEGFISDKSFVLDVASSLDRSLFSVTLDSFDPRAFKVVSDVMSCPGDVTAAYPLLLLSRLARLKGFRVLHCGLGADEIFWGYRAHRLLALSLFIGPSLCIFLSLICSLVISLPLIPFPIKRRISVAKSMLSKTPLFAVAESMRWGSVSDQNFDYFVSTLNKAYTGSYESVGISPDVAPADIFFSHFLASTHLPPADSVSMACSVELRPSLLTRSLFSYFNPRPNLLSIIFKPKYLLKSYVSKHFGSSFANRPKTGFGVEAYGDPCSAKILFDFLLEIIKSSACCTSSIETLINIDFDVTNPTYLISRPMYGLAALAHSCRLIDRIYGLSSEQPIDPSTITSPL